MQKGKFKIKLGKFKVDICINFLFKNLFFTKHELEKKKKKKKKEKEKRNKKKK